MENRSYLCYNQLKGSDQVTEKYENALAFATVKHEGQTRKEGIPYITHPVAVAQMLAQQGYDEEYQLAGLFHDLLEDTDANEAEIIALAGENV
ncbi:MAG: HD domain-containing protein, partial [Clostridia bacterium]|nr:HD domain-containing protein [Clostridia bacterium]